MWLHSNLINSLLTAIYHGNKSFRQHTILIVTTDSSQHWHQEHRTLLGFYSCNNKCSIYGILPETMAHFNSYILYVYVSWACKHLDVVQGTWSKRSSPYVLTYSGNYKMYGLHMHNFLYLCSSCKIMFLSLHVLSAFAGQTWRNEGHTECR